METGDSPPSDKGPQTNRAPPLEESLHGETTEARVLRPLGSAAGPRFTAISGPGAGRSFAMTTELATAGRHPTNDLVLADPRVSAVHLEAPREGGTAHSPGGGG